MAGVLNFSQYLGGPDNINIEQTFPSTQRTLQYNFAYNVTNWTWRVDQQTIVVDTMTFDRVTGTPNFANSRVIGYFPEQNILNTDVADSDYLTVENIVSGVVNITLPTEMYTGPILPDARANVPITVVSVEWTDAGTPPQINSHRWAFIQCWEPTVTPGDPTLTTTSNYISLI
jgi:hypothetical protein